MKRTTALVEGLFRQHFENLAIDEDDRAAGFLRMARQIYDYYQARVKRREVITLPPFQEMYQNVLNELLNPANGMPD